MKLKFLNLKFINYIILIKINEIIISLVWDWGLGIGDWGLGIGDWVPIPNPQSPIPNPQSPKPHLSKFDLI
jgi:hypothetical protein